MAKRKGNKKHGKIDIAMLILLPLAALIISLSFHVNFLTSSLLFFGTPALYLSFRTPKAVLHALLFAVAFSLFGTATVDHLAVMDHAWFVPTIFPFRIFGTVPIEDMVWAIVNSYFIFIFYEHFFDKGKHTLTDPHFKYFFYFITPIFSGFLFLLYFMPALLIIPYFYLLMVIILCVIPVALFLFNYPFLISNILKTSGYFFTLGLLYELTALQLGHWTFPGIHYIGWIQIVYYRFPLEELAFGMLFLASASLTYYEFFDDSVSLNKLTPRK